MNRRQAFKNIGAMFGVNLILPIQRAISGDYEPNNLINHNSFTTSQYQQITAITETIIPQTDTPGAKEADVSIFIDMMLSTWYKKDEKELFLSWLDKFNMHVIENFRKSFNELNLKDQNTSLEMLNQGKIFDLHNGGKDFFVQIKQLTVLGYYTSNIGMTVERRYLPNPGKYDGEYLYKNINTLFTS